MRRRRAADQGRSHRQRPQPADRRGLRPAGVAAVHAVAARAGRAGARRRALPRRGGAGARAAAPAHHRPDAGGGAAAGGARRPHLRGAPCSRSTTAWAWSACSPCSWGSAAAITWVARRVPRPRRPELALAIGNLGAPGGLTRSVVLSLGRRPVAARHRGAGRSLHHRRADRPPAGGEPQLLRARRQALRERCLPRPGRSARRRRPRCARRRCCAAAWSSSATARPSSQGAARGAMGAQRRSRPHLFARRVPEGSTVVAGQWWPADYAGEPLVSFEAEIAKGLRPQDRRHRHRQRARPQRHRRASPTCAR